MLHHCSSARTAITTGVVLYLGIANAASDAVTSVVPDQCPLHRTVTHQGRVECAFDVAVLRVRATRHGPDLYELPADVLMDAAPLIYGPPLGPLLRDVYYAGKAGRYSIRLEPTPGHGTYRRVADGSEVYSTLRAADYGVWARHTNSITVGFWLKRAHWTKGGRAWLKADYVMVSAHPKVSGPEVEQDAQQLLKLTLEDLAARWRRETRQEQAKSVATWPRFSDLRGPL